MQTSKKHSFVLFAWIVTSIWSGCDSQSESPSIAPVSPMTDSPPTEPIVKEQLSSAVHQYSAEETIQFMFLNVPAYTEIAKGDPLATEALFELIQDPRCSQKQWIGFAILGVLGDDSCTPRIVQWLKSRKGVLEPFELRATEFAIRALARMRERGLTGARATIDKMLDPEFWDESFQWEEYAGIPVRYDTAFRVLAACVHQPDYSALRKKLMDRAESEKDHTWLDFVIDNTLKPVEHLPKRQNPETAGTPNYDRIRLRAAVKWRPWFPADPSAAAVTVAATPRGSVATDQPLPRILNAEEQKTLADDALKAFAELRHEICRDDWHEAPTDVERLMKIRTKFLRKDSPLRDPNSEQEKIAGTHWMKLQRDLLLLLEAEKLTPQTPPFLCTTTTEKVEDRSIEVIRIGFRLPGSLNLFEASSSWPALSEGASRGTKSMEYGPDSTESRPILGDFIIYMQRRNGEWRWLPFNS